MKKILFLIILYVQALVSFCQYRERLKENTFDPSGFKNFFVEISFNKKDKIPELHYSTVRFIDARADTSKFGFAVAGSNNEYHRMLFSKPVSEYLSIKLNPLLSKKYDTTKGLNKNESLLFVINDLWLSQIIIPASFGKSMLTGPKDYLCFCYFSADCYLENNNMLIRLGTIDTVVSLKKWIVMGADDLLKKTFLQVMSTADSLLLYSSADSETIIYEEMNTRLNTTYNIPILKSPLNKGVYLTYQDFLANKTIAEDFKIIKDSKKEYIESQTYPDSVFTNAWGYSDGNEIFFHINEKYYRMVRSQNTFELAGPRNISKFYGPGDKILNASVATFFGGIASGGISLILMGSDNQVMKELVPYQLNIKKGTIY